MTAVLETERLVSRRVNALYEISRSFAQTLSLERTLAAVTETLVKELNVDAAVMRVPDERGDQFVPRAVHVADARLADAVRAILEQPQPRPPRTQEPLMLDAALARAAGRRAFAPAAVPARRRHGRAASGRDGHRAARTADDRLARSRGTDHPGDARDRAHDQPAGSARNRQRPPLPAAESSSPRRCSVHCCPASGRRRPGSRSVRSTNPPRRSMSAETSSISSSSGTAVLPSCSATSPGTGSTRPPTWRWRSSCSGHSRASTRSPRRSWPPRTKSSSGRSRSASSSRWRT